MNLQYAISKHGENGFHSLLQNNLKTCVRGPISEGFSRI